MCFIMFYDRTCELFFFLFYFSLIYMRKLLPKCWKNPHRNSQPTSQITWGFFDSVFVIFFVSSFVFLVCVIYEMFSKTNLNGHLLCIATVSKVEFDLPFISLYFLVNISFCMFDCIKFPWGLYFDTYNM